MAAMVTIVGPDQRRRHLPGTTAPVRSCGPSTFWVAMVSESPEAADRRCHAATARCPEFGPPRGGWARRTPHHELASCRDSPSGSTAGAAVIPDFVAGVSGACDPRDKRTYT
ncbi:hypothetical protein CITRIK5_20329 [Citricoccus sp. K5]|nr:hypothetical protein CITRIK5_20329 [Citricoccus sp. K5]